MRKVRLELAYVWTCPACERRNTEEGVTPSLTDEEREEALRVLTDTNPWEETPDGVLMEAPERVQCSCGDWFLVDEA